MHFLTGLLFWPGMHLKALLNSSRLDVGPFTLKNQNSKEIHWVITQVKYVNLKTSGL